MIIHRLHLTAKKRQTLERPQRVGRSNTKSSRPNCVSFRLYSTETKQPGAGELTQAYLQRMEIIQPRGFGSLIKRKQRRTSSANLT